MIWDSIVCGSSDLPPFSHSLDSAVMIHELDFCSEWGTGSRDQCASIRRQLQLVIIIVIVVVMVRKESE